MFGNVVYYDKGKIDEYKSIIIGQKNLEIDEYEISNDKGIKLDLKAIGADTKASKSYKARVQESLLYSCNEFEKLLIDREDFCDFTESSEFDITTMQRGVIIKFDGYINIPQEFDLTQTIGKFKNMIMASMINDEMDMAEQEALKVFMETSDAKIPVIIDFDDQILCSKLAYNNMAIKYEDLEEYEELEVTIIARVISGNMVSKGKAFYDPLKDFMALNRSVRRSIDDRTEGLYELFADRDYRKIEILAIYQ